MRIRTIKPEFFQSEKIADLEPLTRILFIGLWCMADVEGRLEDRSRLIKAKILPHDQCEIEEMLNDLRAAGKIIRYEIKGAKLIQIVGFTKHQRINGREADGNSSYPAPGKHGKIGNSTELHGIPRARALEGKGREGKGSTSVPLAPREDDFISDMRKMDAYQSLNIELEFKKMRGWLITRPARKLTRRFAINWLNKALTDQQVIATVTKIEVNRPDLHPDAYEPIDIRALAKERNGE